MSDNSSPIRYVVGFLFSPDKSDVLLIQKNRPEWQAGRLNGVGGKVEQDETAHEAMVREFAEETGMEVPGWDHAGVMMGSDYRVEVFSAIGDVRAARSMTDEAVRVIHIGDLVYSKTVLNLQWMIPFLAIRETQTFLVRES